MPYILPLEKNFPHFNNNNYYNNCNLSNYINNNSVNVYSNSNQNEQNLFKKFPKGKKTKKEKKNFYKKYKEKRSSDWICNRCSNLNYSFRTFCNICKLPLKDNSYYESDFD